MARKIKATTDNSGWVEPKKRKRRKPMTEKQRQAAAKRLEKAREKRAAKNPDYGMSGIHHSLRDLPDDHPAHPKKVKVWIKTQKNLLLQNVEQINKVLKVHMQNNVVMKVMLGILLNTYVMEIM